MPGPRCSICRTPVDRWALVYCQPCALRLIAACATQCATDVPPAKDSHWHRVHGVCQTRIREALGGVRWTEALRLWREGVAA